MKLRKAFSRCRSWMSGTFKPAAQFNRAADYGLTHGQEAYVINPAKTLQVLVTGSSSGFGELIAKTLAKAAHHVFASMRGVGSRNLEAAARLRQWAESEGVALEVVDLDVTDQHSVDQAISSVERVAGHIDVVINNAGAGGMGIVEAFSIDQMRQMFDVNTFGTMRVNKAVLPGMRRRKSGLIIHVTSTAGRIVIPEGNPYIATKFAIEALAESLHHQLAPFGIDVVILEPGYYPTTSFDEKKTPPADAEVSADYAAMTAAKTPTRNNGERAAMQWPDPQEVADVIRQLIEMPQGERPLRIVVGSVASAGVAELNSAYDKCKKKMLRSIGIPV